MIVPATLTVLFVLLAGYSVVDALKPNLFHRISALLHIVMAVVMALMWWPLWTELPLMPQLIIFAAATVMYLAVASALALKKVTLAQIAGHSFPNLLYHAAMFASMTWMVWAMGETLTGRAPGAVLGLLFVSVLAGCAGIFAVDAALTPAPHVAPTAGRAGRTLNWLQGRKAEMFASALMCLGMLAMMVPMLIGGGHQHG